MQYLGLMDCQYYQGKVGEIDHKCCGGKISKWARIQCKKRGVVTAQDICTQKCEYSPNHDVASAVESPKTDTNQKGDVMKLISESNSISSVDGASLKFDEVSKSIGDAEEIEKGKINLLDESNQNTDIVKQHIVAPIQDSLNDGDQKDSNSKQKTIWQVWTEEILAGNAKH